MATSSSPLVNALTMGEPAGIGGELTVKTWAKHRGSLTPFVALDDADRLRAIAAALGLDVHIQIVKSTAEAVDIFADALPVLPLKASAQTTPGKPSPETAAAVIESITRAVLLVRAGEASAVVTNPIQKDTLYAAGFKFPGHTEYLGDLDGGALPVMMLASPMLRVVPVTVHVPLRTALDTLSTESIVTQGRMVIEALRRDFGVAAPRLAVAGLNPHAGETGTLGDDEDRIIRPAIKALQDLDADVFGPVPPDALFTPRARDGYDAALCMYHDQALIPIKALDVDRAVNVTLGLSFVRTSPDHGTALDIAGKGIAELDSLIAALRMAGEISSNRRRHTNG